MTLFVRLRFLTQETAATPEWWDNLSWPQQYQYVKTHKTKLKITKQPRGKPNKQPVAAKPTHPHILKPKHTSVVRPTVDTIKPSAPHLGGTPSKPRTVNYNTVPKESPISALDKDNAKVILYRMTPQDRAHLYLYMKLGSYMINPMLIKHKGDANQIKESSVKSALQNLWNRSFQSGDDILQKCGWKKGDNLVPFFQKSIQTMDRLTQNKLKDDAILYRGISTDSVNKFKLGSEYTSHGFTSTSTGLDHASWFSDKFVKHYEWGGDPDFLPVIRIHMKKGNSAFITNNGMEEVLLPRQSKFRVLGHEVAYSKYTFPRDYSDPQSAKVHGIHFIDVEVV